MLAGSPWPVSPSAQIGAPCEMVARIVVLKRSLILLNVRPHVNPAIRVSAEKRSRPF